MIHLALLLSISCATSSAPITPAATIEQFHVNVRTTHKSISLHVATITAAKIRVVFNRPLIDPLTPLATIQGLTQLICDDHTLGGRYQLFESYELSPPKHYHGSLPRRLLPIWDDNDYYHVDDPFGRLLLEIASHQDGERKTNEYMAIFPLSSVQTVLTSDNGTVLSISRTSTMTLKDMSSCVLRFVHPENQVLASPIPFFFQGDVKLKMKQEEQNIEDSRESTNERSKGSSSNGGSRGGYGGGGKGGGQGGRLASSTSVSESAARYVEARTQLIREANRLSKIVGFLPTDVEACVPMPMRSNSSKKSMRKEDRRGDSVQARRQEREAKMNDKAVTSLAETAAELFVSGEEGMANGMTALANIGVPNLGGVLMVPMKDVGKDFSQLAAGDMADSTTGVMQGTSAGQVDQSMTEQITGLLSRGLKSRLTETLVPPLKQTVVSSVASSTTQIFQSSLTKVLTSKLEQPLLEAITKQCTYHMPKHMDNLLPQHLARLLSKDLNHLLSRSIPHSLVPALVHTLTHNPMQDYYCFYCYHHKTYCQFCSYAPSQMYYAEFYTGYYSTYYGDYYGDYALRQMSAQDLTRKKIKEDE